MTDIMTLSYMERTAQKPMNSAIDPKIRSRSSSGKSSPITLLLLLLILLSACVAVFCLSKYLFARRQYRQAEAGNAALTEAYIALATPAPPIEAPAEDEAPPPPYEKTSPITVDFPALSEQALPGVVAGWLYCEGTDINYPIAHYHDNDFFLDHQIDGMESVSGTLFIDARCKGDFSDRNTVIYGHHMHNETMFHSLKYYRLEEGYYDAHPSLFINTPSQNYEMIVYSCFMSDTSSKALTVGFSSDDDFRDFLDLTLEQNVLIPHAEVGELSVEDRIVTLVTCSYESNVARTYLCGVLRPVG